MIGSHRAIQETNKARVAVAGGVLLGALFGVTLAAPAFADTLAPSGPFNFTGHQAGEEHVYTGVWTFSACGQDCVTANADDLVVKNWQFHLNNGTWTANSAGTLPCFSGGAIPVTYTSTFDAATMTGQWTRTRNGACGNLQPGTDQETFELTQG